VYLIHERLDEEDAPAGPAKDIFRSQWVGYFIRIEPGALVRDTDNQRVGRRFKRSRNVLAGVVRVAMAICGIVSSSKPARCATCSAVSSILLTLSRDESNVKLTRLVVESAKNVLVLPGADRQPR
jgi:hypothetical protein